MATADGRGQVLRATLCEIERGVFYVTYPDASTDGDLEGTYQVGISAAHAKRHIEDSARERGYETVFWKDASVAPLFASGSSPTEAEGAHCRV